MESIVHFFMAIYNKIRYHFITEQTVEEKSGTIWTNNEIASLVNLMEDGLTDEEIAVCLNRTVSSIYQKRRRILKQREQK